VATTATTAGAIDSVITGFAGKYDGEFGEEAGVGADVGDGVVRGMLFGGFVAVSDG